MSRSILPGDIITVAGRGSKPYVVLAKYAAEANKLRYVISCTSHGASHFLTEATVADEITLWPSEHRDRRIGCDVGDLVYKQFWRGTSYPATFAVYGVTLGGFRGTTSSGVVMDYTSVAGAAQRLLDSHYVWLKVLLGPGDNVVVTDTSGVTVSTAANITASFRCCSNIVTFPNMPQVLAERCRELYATGIIVDSDQIKQWAKLLDARRDLHG